MMNISVLVLFCISSVFQSQAHKQTKHGNAPTNEPESPGSYSTVVFAVRSVQHLSHISALLPQTPVFALVRNELLSQHLQIQPRAIKLFAVLLNPTVIAAVVLKERLRL